MFNTRPRDFYDAYILTTTQQYDRDVFTQALRATADHRGTAQQIENVPEILKSIYDSAELKTMWDKYRKQFAYAENIEFDQIVTVLQALLS